MEGAINQRVKKARNLLHLSQEEVAEAINKKVPAVSKIEAGSQSVTPDLLTFYNRKGINSHWLLTGEGEPFKPDQTTGHNISGNRIKGSGISTFVGSQTGNPDLAAECERLRSELENLKRLLAAKEEIISLLKQNNIRPTT